MAELISHPVAERRKIKLPNLAIARFARHGVQFARLTGRRSVFRWDQPTIEAIV
ncbi:hypothetical protein [Rhodanobacter sp. MP1X3]|uniref:hypothetical protein n=1 Tax=Rhodanobacter sp. MP1X3 TaxID=2723086 RepID=UPI00161E1CCE|nr:hypothetical protein [Rhodanobacter sp. MP1X3]MBB6244394.1 hypothetical protein [Rhodanobacter sp. MP1X3]